MWTQLYSECLHTEQLGSHPDIAPVICRGFVFSAFEDGQRLARRAPITLVDAAKRLAEQTGKDFGRCPSQLQAMLIMMSRTSKERGGVGDRAFLAFKLTLAFADPTYAFS
jgi:hypothetical protein